MALPQFLPPTTSCNHSAIGECFTSFICWVTVFYTQVLLPLPLSIFTQLPLCNSDFEWRIKIVSYSFLVIFLYVIMVIILLKIKTNSSALHIYIWIVREYHIRDRVYWTFISYQSKKCNKYTPYTLFSIQKTITKQPKQTHTISHLYNNLES